MLDAEAMPPPAPAARGLALELKILQGPDRGKVHAIGEGEHLVGRGLDCQIVLADPAVSRKHFRLVRRGDSVDVLDMGGANGTNVNGNRVSRHTMRPGDRIEIGTTVMEYVVPGATPERARDFPSSSAPPARVGPPPPGSKKSNGLLIAGIATAGLVVLGGGAVAAWLVMSGNSQAAPEQEEGEREADTSTQIAALVDEAKGHIASGAWSDAHDVLLKARKLSKDDDEVKGLMAKVDSELEAQESVEEGQALVQKHQYRQAIERFKAVPNTSHFFKDATQAVETATGSRDDWIRTRLAAATAAIDAGDRGTAVAAIGDVLDQDPDHAEAKVLKPKAEGLPDTGGSAAPRGPGAERGAAIDEKPHDDKGTGAGGGNAKGQLDAGLKAYRDRRWTDAETAFGQAATAGSRKDKDRAEEYRSATRSLAEGWQQAESAGGSHAKAAEQWRRAYDADKRIAGHHGAFLKEKLAVAMIGAARSLLKGGKLAEAAAKARDAMDANPDMLEVLDLVDECQRTAKERLQEAERQMAAKNYGKAKELAEQAMRAFKALAPSAPEATKARQVLEAASKAYAAGDD